MGIYPSTFPAALLQLVAVSLFLATTGSALDFLFNSFSANNNQLNLIGDAYVDGPVIRLTRESTGQSSVGRAFFPTPVRMRRPRTVDESNASIASFSTSFVFSISQETPNDSGFGLAFVISSSIEPPGALPGKYFGIFTNSTVPTVAPLLAVEFDTGRDTVLGDPDSSHVGIDLNDGRSVVVNSSRDGSWPFIMWTSENIRAWIDFDGENLSINVTIALADSKYRPQRPLVSYANPSIAGFISEEMYVGFSASKATSSGSKWIERQRLLAWSFTDEGRPARELDTSGLPEFSDEFRLYYFYNSDSQTSYSHLGVKVAAIVVGSVAAVGLLLAAFFWVWRRRCGKTNNIDGEFMDWEQDYWPHRFSYDNLLAATKGFAEEELLGSGGFGKVYKGFFPTEPTAIAVKCISHDSKQGLKEFMAEISSIGRLRHKNLVPMRGWCRHDNELMLVYDYMPNGSLYYRIFHHPNGPLDWEVRLSILTDVAQGLYYLHHGWDKIVIHRDIKSSNILLDEEMRGRLGDFGLAKLCEHGEAPRSTRLVGTLGYLAPELAWGAAPTTSSDVYSFGVVMLEVASGRRPIESGEEVATVLVDVVRELCAAGQVMEAADRRLPTAAYSPEEMRKVLELGLRCCHPDPNKRPTMKVVMAVLRREDDGPITVKITGLDRRVVSDQSDSAALLIS